MLHKIHINSLLAFRTLKREARWNVIFRVYEQCGSITDRDVARHLGFDDMNAVRPRITEMIADGILIECGVRRDETTRKTVRVVRCKTPDDERQLKLF